MSFSGRIALVTGAGRGIGTAIASRLAAKRAHLVLVDIDGKEVERTAAHLRKEGWLAESHTADVSCRAEVTRVVSKVLSRHGVIDILVNNAGMIRDGLLLALTEQDWDRVLDVNLKGAFLFCQAVCSPMKEKKYGKIVNISSRAWLGNPGQVNYSAAKGGLISLTRTLALELARFQINVNAVAPGLIDTPMTRGLTENVRDRLLKMQPTGRMGTVEDIAAAVEFLSSDDAPFITGQVLHVDGGKSCGLSSL